MGAATAEVEGEAAKQILAPCLREHRAANVVPPLRNCAIAQLRVCESPTRAESEAEVVMKKSASYKYRGASTRTGPLSGTRIIEIHL